MRILLLALTLSACTSPDIESSIGLVSPSTFKCINGLLFTNHDTGWGLAHINILQGDGKPATCK